MTPISSKFLLKTYRLAAFLLTPILIPASAALMALREKHRKQIPCRLGMLPDYSSLKDRAPLIWLHALSAGEVNAASPLLDAIINRWENAGIICSASTSTGLILLKKRAAAYPNMVTTCLPLDLPPLTRHVISRVRPDCFILTETDIWPDMIWRLRENEIPALLVNGSISSKAAHRLKLLQRIGIDAASLLYEGFHTVAMQSEDDLKRLETIAPLPNLTCCRNLKFDIATPDVDATWIDEKKRELLISPDEFIIVAGSTHPGEEELLASAFSKLIKTGGSIIKFRFIVAPRDNKRADEVRDIFRAAGFSTGFRSRVQQRPHQVIILDTLGELSAFYALGKAAFVGGSLVPVGGHNLFEPAILGIPVIFGPFIESCRDMAELLIACKGGISISSSEELFNALHGIASARSKQQNMAKQAKACVEAQRGAVKEYIKLIENALSGR